jgi:predicted phosphodiesterase
LSRTLFIGDIHGCSKTFNALLDQAKPHRIILLGDLFAKGPDPEGVWRTIKNTGAESVLGNHDARVLEVWDKEGESVHHQAARALPEEAKSWIAALPLFLSGAHAGRTWVAVHAGLHPELGIPGTTRRIATVVRRWPDDEDRSNPFWWQLYSRKELVIYGHDAMRGVQQHPRTIGLDSGCMYGGKLSGWVLESNELFQVPKLD